MKLHLYQCLDDNNKFNKTLQEDREFDYIIKDNNGSDIDKPSVLLHNDDSIDFLIYNYAYIPKLKRYYFVSNINLYRNNLIRLDLDIDVLQTFKEDIKTIMNNKVEIETFTSDKSINTADEKKYILLTIGS